MERDIDRIIRRLQAEYPALRAKQLRVAHPGADDDGLWFVSHPGAPLEVQIESPDGNCPFLIENA